MVDDLTVLVIGENTFPFHRFEERESFFVDVLSDIVDVETTTDKGRFASLTDYDVIVDNTTDSTLTDAQRDGLLDFVADGGGYVGVHAAADLTTTADGDRDEPVPELRDLIGGHFLTHPEQTTFRVELDDHPITTDVDDFDVHDEPYQVDWDDDIAVHGRMDHPDLQTYPVLWTKPYGNGRVCYLSLGHTEAAFETAAFRRLLRNAVEWVGVTETGT